MEGKSSEDADEALETYLEFTPQWVNFKAPLMITAVNRIQNEVLRRYDRKPGEYNVFCSQLESMFMSPVIVALEEYGVPIQLGKRLVPMLGSPETLDEALTALAKRQVQEIKGVSNFERELIRPLCKDEVPDGS